MKVKPVLKNLPRVIRLLKEECRQWTRPAVETLATGRQAPFKALVSTLLSLRTKDRVTTEASLRLFRHAVTPEAMLRLDAARIEKIIYPVGFYRTKARNLLKISQQLLERFGGRVPDTLEALLELPGVGRKTANLVVSVAYGKPGICVDTHVHRISNRWALVRTKSPDETEQALRRILPTRYWMSFNELLVAYGQNLCVPVSPFCGRCRIARFCARRGVRKSR